MELRRTVLVLAIVAVAGLHAQELDAVIYLPDSLARQHEPSGILLDPVGHLVYVTGGDEWMVAVDGRSLGRVAGFSMANHCSSLGVNVARNKLYALDEWGTVWVVDCRGCSVVAMIEVASDIGTLCCPSGSDRVYCLLDSPHPALDVIDAATDEVVAILELGELRFTGAQPLLALDPAGRMLYVPTDGWPWRDLQIVGVDCRVDSVTCTIPMDPIFEEVAAICWDSVNNLLHCVVVDTLDGMSVLMVDPATRSVVGTVHLSSESFEVAGFAYNPASDKLYCLSSEDPGLHIIDVAGRRHLDYYAFYGDISALCVEPVRNKVYCVYDHWGVGSIAVIDGESDNWIADIEPLASPWCDPENPSQTLACDPDAGLLYYVGDGAAVVGVVRTDLDTVAGYTTTGCCPSGIELHPGREKLYCACECEGILLIDPATGRTTGRVAGSDGACDLELDPSRDRLCFTSRTRWWTGSTIAVLDCATDSVVDTLLHLSGYDHISFCLCPEDGRLYCSLHDSGRVLAIDLETGDVLARFPLKVDRGPFFDPAAGRVFAQALADSEWYAFDVATDSLVWTCDEGNQDGLFVLDTAGHRLYVGSGEPSELLVYDTRSLVLLSRVALPRNPGCAAWNRTMDLTYCGLRQDSPGVVLVIDDRTGTVLDSLATGDAAPVLLAHSPASNRLYCIDAEGGVAVVDCRTNEVVRRFDEDRFGEVREVLVDEEGGRVYVANSDNLAVFSDPAPAHAALGEAGPTLFSRNVTLLGTRNANLVDAVGRRVAVLCPGDNDLAGIPAGIYFVCRPSDSISQKIIIP